MNITSTAELVALLSGGSLGATFLYSGGRYAFTGPDRRALMRKAWQIRANWRRTAIRVGLCQTEHAAKVGADIPTVAELVHERARQRTLVPRLKVHVEAWGLRIEAETLGRIGLGEFQAAADYLADQWRVPLVRVERSRPGFIRIRVLLSDPLTVATEYAPNLDVLPDLRSWLVGIDADAQDVTVRCSGVSGVVVAGLAGYGKTSLINTRFCQLAPSPAVQFVLIDGKGGPDYDDLVCRAWLDCKDDLDDALAVGRRVHRLMTTRQSGIRPVLGVKNIWSKRADGSWGPSVAWPLVLVVIDECHTFFNETKDKDFDAKVREFTRLVEELVRKGRNVGIQVLLATQKATGDAIPTKIRDNCQVAVSFAQRTSEAAVAALGSDIADYPEAHPRRLQHPDYIGVASMVAEGRQGFTLVRTPRTDDELAAEIAEKTKDLVTDPLALIEYQLQGLHVVPDDDAQAA